MASKGFTLIELLVVMIIIGILAAVAVPKYNKTIETSRANEAQSLLQTVYTGNRMYKINNPSASYCTGAVDGSNGCTVGSNLITRNYVSNLTGLQYAYYAANDATAGTYIACTRRNGGAYGNWSYRITAAGVKQHCTDAPAGSDSTDIGACPICP